MLIPFDADEDGRMDLIVQSGGGTQYGLHLIYNNFFYDSYFLKAMMLSQEYDNPLKKEQYGAITTGATFRYVITNVDDKKTIRVATQSPQNSFGSLELPYVYMGVGRSNNYLEDFNVAYSLNNNFDQIRVFTPIIPNSQLIIVGNSKNKLYWNMDLFIKPNQILELIVMTMGAVLVISGIVIIVMHIMEKREDIKNRPQIDF